MVSLPTAQDLRMKIARIEGERASAAMKAHEAAMAEKDAFLARISKPSGLTDEQVLEKAGHIVERAVSNGLTSVQIFRFPNNLCTDGGRAIDQGEGQWEKTLTGIPKEIYEFWKRQLEPRGYRIGYTVIDRPGGLRGDIGVFLHWD